MTILIRIIFLTVTGLCATPAVAAPDTKPGRWLSTEGIWDIVSVKTQNCLYHSFGEETEFPCGPLGLYYTETTEKLKSFHYSVLVKTAL